MTDERFVASDAEMETRRAFADLIDNDLSRQEMETGAEWFASDDYYSVTTYVPTIARSLLKHRYARFEWCYVEGLRDRRTRVEDLAALEGEPGIRIEGVRVALPIGTLTVKGQPRSSDRLSGIVTTTREAEEVAAAFRGGDSE